MLWQDQHPEDKLRPPEEKVYCLQITFFKIVFHIYHIICKNYYIFILTTTFQSYTPRAVHAFTTFVISQIE